MAKYYVTYSGCQERIYESDKLNECIRKAKQIVEEESKETYVRTEGKAEFRSYSVKPYTSPRMKHPKLIKDDEGCICADIPSYKNNGRDTSARYNFDKNILVIAGNIIEKHPKFKNIDKFENWVSTYFAQGKDGYDPDKRNE